MSDLFVRWLVLSVPFAVAAMAGLIGVEYQRQAEALVPTGVPTGVATSVPSVSTVLVDHLHRIRELSAWLSVIGVVGLATLSMWSGLVVTNATRVGHSLRTPWFAAIGWLLAPGLGVLAHVMLDSRLESGWLVGLTVFLAVMFVPFGTLGGAAADLGGTPHLSRTWYMTSVIGAFLLIVGMSGATTALPVNDPENVLKIRAFACYLSSLMLLTASAFAVATVHSLNGLIAHRWAMENDPDGVLNDPKRLKISRTGRQLQRRLTPTLFLRIIVTAGVLGCGLATAAATYVFGTRAVRADGLEEGVALDDLRTTMLAIGIIALSVHVAYTLWAVLAARNAYRRSLLAPSPWAVIGAFFLGPLVLFGGSRLTGPFGAAVLTVGVILAGFGFIVGQMVLGRTVAALGGRGRIFLTWMGVDIASALLIAATSAHATDPLRIAVFVVVQATAAALVGALAWQAMSRLDRTCREYRAPGSADADVGGGGGGPLGGGPDASRQHASGWSGPAQPGSLAFTSSHS